MKLVLLLVALSVAAEISEKGKIPNVIKSPIKSSMKLTKYHSSIKIGVKTLRTIL